MRKEIFVTTIEEIEELKCKYNLDDCGMSGRYDGWHWLSGEEIDVYYKL